MVDNLETPYLTLFVDTEQRGPKQRGPNSEDRRSDHLKKPCSQTSNDNWMIIWKTFITQLDKTFFEGCREETPSLQTPPKIIG